MVLEWDDTWGLIDPEAPCGCCELNDYDPPPDDPYGPCEQCGHSPEEHQCGS